jgi:macrolide-specific efflux system membrane fusion protein
MTKKSWRPGWGTWAIVVGLGLAAWGIQHFYFTKPALPPMITAKVTRQNLEDTVLASGTIQAAKEVNVGAQVSGQIKKLYVGMGDTVKKGDLVAEIDSTTQNNTLRNAEASVASLQAQRDAKLTTLKQARLTLARSQELVRQDAGSREDLEAAEAAVGTTQAEVASLDAQIRQAQITADTARVNLGYTRILAPMDGVVIAIIMEEGRTVNALQSAPTIIKLAKLDTVLVRAQISEADVVRVKPGLPAYFTILGDPDTRIQTKLRAIEPVPEDDQTETKVTTSTATTTAIYYNGLFDVPNPDGKLRALMTAQVNIVLHQAKDALVIPASALSKQDPKTKAYTVQVVSGPPDARRVERREVHVGLNNRVQAQILDGLKEGDVIVVGEASGSSSSTQMRRPPGMF